MTIAQLGIQLSTIGVAAVTGDLGRVSNSLGTMDTAAKSIRGALAGLVSGLSIAAFSGWIKSAIDAGDATKQFSQQTGVAARDVAGLQLAFKQGGIDSDALSSALGKMSRQMVEGNSAFDKLGVATRNADGSVRSIKATLYDTAEAFAGIRDGAAKSALAQEIFGKTGALLIPVLNEGAAGLREMAAMAEKLGLVIDADMAEGADKFNDTVELLGLGLQGVGRQIAAQLLPSLNSLAGGFLETMTSGDTLRQVAEALGAGLKILFTVIVGGAQVFNTFGKTLGALGGQLMALATGDFKMVAQIGREWVQDIKSNWTTTVANLGKVWDGTAAKTAEAGAKSVRAMRDVKVATNDQSAAMKAAAKEAEKYAEEQRKLTVAGAQYLVALMKKNQATQQEIDLGRELTEAEKGQAKLSEELAAGKMKMTAEAEKLARALIDQNQKLREEKQWLDETKKANEAAYEAQRKATASLSEQVEQQRESNEVIGLNTRELAARETAMMRDDAAAKERLATEADLYDWTGKTSEEFRKQAALLRERAGLVEAGVIKKEAQEASAEWAKTTDSIFNGLTDSLMRAFESGKGFAKAFRDTLVNAFKTLVLQPTIKWLMQPLQSAVGSLFGVPMTANAGGLTSAGGMLGNLGSVASSIGSSLGAFGTAASYGFEAFLGGNALTAAGGGLEMLAAGNIAQGLGMSAGALGPYALAALAVYSLVKKLDKSGTPHLGSVVTAGAEGVTTGGADASRILDNLNTEVDNALKMLAGGAVGVLNTVSQTFGGGKDFASVAAFASDNQDPSFGQFKLTKAGATVGDISGTSGHGGDLKAYESSMAEGFAQFSADVAAVTLQALRALELPDWAAQEVAKLNSGSTLDQIAAVAASLVQAKADKENVTPEAAADALSEPLAASISSAPVWQDIREATAATAESSASTIARLESVIERQDAQITQQGEIATRMLETLSELRDAALKQLAMQELESAAPAVPG